MMKNLFDNHSHCQFSFDGKNTSIEKSSRSTFEKGLGGICFTDHNDIYVPDETKAQNSHADDQLDIKAQQAEIDRVQAMFPDIKILKGIELGMHPMCRQGIRDLVAANHFDQVIVSVHYVGDTDPYFGGYYKGRDWKTAYGGYLETIAEEIQAVEDFDIVGHYDYIVRYCDYEQVDLLYKDFSDIFDEIFRYIIHNGKALEINTKSYQNFNGRQANLDKNILLRYREMGGEIISFGSDSHYLEHVGLEFEKYAAIVKSLGFKWAAHYENRKLIQFPL